MCGIVGTSWSKKAREFIIGGLEKLEYRGYDSAGIYYIDKDNKSNLIRTIERVKKLKDITPHFDEGIAIGHTRWATHGGVSINNSHPQSSYDQKVFVVHNGIISNYKEIKASLIDSGIKFVSDTDTECISNLFSFCLYKKKMSEYDALKYLYDNLKGQMSALIYDNKKLFFIKKGSPLLIGKSDDEVFLASDSLPLIGYANKVCYLEDKTYGIINKNKIKVFKDNKKIKLKFVKLDDSNGNISLGNYDYYMLKEIDEEPDRLLDLSNKIEKEVPSELLDCLRNEKIMILGSGTSYHAGLYAKKWFKATNMIASEFVYDDKEYDNYTFVLLSQSGETFDLIKAIEKIRSGQNNKIISLINKENTTIERLSDFYLNLHAQPEIAVASTKVYLNEVVALYILYQILNNKEYKDSIKELVENLKKVSANKDYIYEYAKKISKVKNAYFVGRGFDYKLALEASLKLKEVSYIHSEATYAGELKHGPIALIDKNFLTIFMITDKKFNDIIDSNISEINARFGKIMILSTTGIESKYDGFIVNYHSDLSGLVLIMFAQYLSYYVALNRKLNIDKPKNLAKSVTVE